MILCRDEPFEREYRIMSMTRHTTGTNPNIRIAKSMGAYSLLRF